MGYYSDISMVITGSKLPAVAAGFRIAHPQLWKTMTDYWSRDIRFGEPFTRFHLETNTKWYETYDHVGAALAFWRYCEDASEELSEETDGYELSGSLIELGEDYTVSAEDFGDGYSLQGLEIVQY